MCDMRWEKREPLIGDIVRVRAQGIWHYGVCVGDGDVVQFGRAAFSRSTKLDCICVEKVTLDRFCKGLAFFAASPRASGGGAYSAESIAERALSRIGEKGYDFSSNNCEHFAYECAFGLHIAPETEKFEKLLKAVPKVYACVSSFPFSEEQLETGLGIFPSERRRTIEKTKNPEVRKSKYYVWRLLEYLLKSAYGIKMSDARLHIDEHGKWHADGFYLSLSHVSVRECENALSCGVVAAALSNRPVGIDVELFDSHRFGEKLARHILTDNEMSVYRATAPEKRPLFAARAWTAKESIFKKNDEAFFRPKSICTLNGTSSKLLSCLGREFILTIAGENAEKSSLTALFNTKVVENAQFY